MDTRYDVGRQDEQKCYELMAYTYYWVGFQRRLPAVYRRRPLPVVMLTEEDKACIYQLLINHFFTLHKISMYAVSCKEGGYALYFASEENEAAILHHQVYSMEAQRIELIFGFQKTTLFHPNKPWMKRGKSNKEVLCMPFYIGEHRVGGK